MELDPAACRISSIKPEDVIRFAPGEIVAEADASDAAGRNLFFRDIAYGASTVAAPGIDSILMVVYRRGETRMRRRVDGNWYESDLKPGHISLLGVDRSSDWEWGGDIEVSHFYLSKDLMAKTAQRAFDRDYRHFRSMDSLCIQDATLLGLADALENELRTAERGSRLLTDLVSQALTLQVLRDHHTCEQPARSAIATGTALTTAQRQRVVEFLEANLAKNFSLADLASAVGLCEHAFPSRFKASFEQSPWQFVLARRVERAMDLIRDRQLSLAEIAFVTGFSDQAHMTRVMKRLTGQTPGHLRRA